MKRDSYENRICDDLSEVILQFLSLKDKLRLECVSQQFRRTVFSKHYSLDVMKRMRQMSLTSVLILSNKLKNLRSIHLGEHYDNIYYYERINRIVVEVIIFDCNHLQKINFNGFVCNDLMDLFISKFGSNLTSIGFTELKAIETTFVNQWNTKNSFYRRFPNIEDLKISHFSDLSDVCFERLRKLNVSHISEKEITNFEVFIENHRNSLKTICLPSRNEKIFTSVSKLKNLVDLNFYSNLEISDQSIVRHLSKIALNCNQLKRVYFCFQVNENQSFDNILSFLMKFKALKHLVLNLDFTQREDLNEISFKKLVGFQKLTHICFFIFPFGFTLGQNNQFFEDIDKNVPNLQSLIIFPSCIIKCNEDTAQILSLLSDLKNIHFEVTNDSPKYEIEAQLRDKCKRIERISIEVTQHIDEIDFMGLEETLEDWDNQEEWEDPDDFNLF